MSPKPMVRAAVLALTTVVAVACASTPDYPGNRENYQAFVEVNNNGSSLSNFTVHLVSATGPRQRLGNVNLNEVKTFDVTRPSSGGYYRLQAILISGAEVFSPQFALTEGDKVVWDLRRNRVLFYGNAR
ncbi:MAG: hypothetical protein RLN75_01655 [Longimicrobiales bacterium]